VDRFKRRFYDSHPRLPLDPDSDQLKITRPIHTDSAHIAVVAFGAFFGTLLRYEMTMWIPVGDQGWPTATLAINIAGAFLLGLLLQVLLHHGKDEGGRRIMRLLVGTGFMGAFTTYSSLATGTVLLTRDGHVQLAVEYALTSVIAGVIAAAAGIWVASAHHRRSRT
jgi:fluoride exporter